jgi:hypothetical protein
MENENIGAIQLVSTEPTEVSEPQVVEPEVAELDSVAETPAQEVAEPEKGTDSWYAKNRREKEAAEKALNERTAEIEAIRKQNEELMTFKAEMEAKQKDNELRKLAEEYGVPYEELLAETQKEEEKEQLTEKLTAKEQREAELVAELEELKREKVLDAMYQTDREILRSIDPEIKLEELGEDFYSLRFAGIDTETAYHAIMAKKAKTEVAPKVGKVDTTPAESTGIISEAEWDSMSDSEKSRLIAKDYQRVYDSQKTWLRD